MQTKASFVLRAKSCSKLFRCQEREMSCLARVGPTIFFAPRDIEAGIHTPIFLTAYGRRWTRWPG